MQILTQNVQCAPAMVQPRVVHDVELSGDEAGLIGWQEIELPRYRDAIRGLPDRFNHVFGPRWCGQAISYNTHRFDLLDSGTEVLHGGAAEMCGLRGITWARLEHRRSGIEFVFNTAHYVSGVGNPNKDRQELRRRLWNQGAANHRRLITGWVEQGLPVATTGDFNARGPVLGERLGGRPIRYVTPPLSIDVIALVNGADFVWKIEGAETMPGRFSDHQGRRATVRLHAR